MKKLLLFLNLKYFSFGFFSFICISPSHQNSSSPFNHLQSIFKSNSSVASSNDNGFMSQFYIAFDKIFVYYGFGCFKKENNKLWVSSRCNFDKISLRIKFSES